MVTIFKCIIFCFFFLTSCSKVLNDSDDSNSERNEDGTTTGNPLVKINFKSFSESITSQSATTFMASPQISHLKFCFKKLRFKIADSETSDTELAQENIDFNLGEVDILAEGTTLSTVNVPVGLYKRIEFDLDDRPCNSRKSVVLQNTFGSFQSSEHIILKFKNQFAVTSETKEINLNLQSIINALNKVTTDDNIRDYIQNFHGD